MTESSTPTKGSSPRQRRSPFAAALGLTALAIFGATGCDTVAQIAFSERQLQAVRPIGLSPAAGGQCGGIEDKATLKMVLMANDSTPVKPGEALSLATVNPTRGDFTFRDGRLFSFPDQVCESGVCPDGLQCSPPPTGIDALGNRCSRTTPIGVSGEPRFVGTQPKKQALAVVMSNEGRWRGWLPRDVGNLLPANADGTAPQTSQRDLGPNPGRAGDNTGMRHGAMRQLSADFETLSEYLEHDEREILYGYWSFSESSATIDSWVGELAGDGVPWTRRYDRIDRAIERAADFPAAQGDRANIYASAINILKEGFQAPPAAGEEGHDPNHWYWSLFKDVEKKTMILVVGGPDEYRQNRNSVDVLIDLAKEAGVEVHIVHADPPMDESLLRDDPKYYEEQTAGCSDDSDCKNFETCRVPQFFCDRDQPGACTSLAYPTDTSKKVCLPARDENGRTGPIHDYQRLACETGGSYSYLPVMTTSLLYNRISGIPFSTEAAWEVDINLDEAASLFPGQPFSFAGDLEVNIGRTATYSFSQFGRVGGDAAVPASWDTRLIFFRKDE